MQGHTDLATINEKPLTALSLAMLSELNHRRTNMNLPAGKRLWFVKMSNGQRNVARGLMDRRLVDYGTENGGWIAINGDGIERLKQEIKA